MNNLKTTNTWYTLGQIIDNAEVGDQFECENNKYQLEIDNRKCVMVSNKNGLYDMLYVNSIFREIKWKMKEKYVSCEEALKAHKESNKTIVFHQDEELKYRFEHSMDPGQFEQLANDSICLHEMLNGKWTIEE